ncbi:hypothetical protein NMY22_g13893 [Coprinellus aureogranulatus]|nr:hypothetical protein NMY22_g13893 [Coprinellus aureogranulatus]
MTANTHYDFVSAAQRLEQLVAERSIDNLAGRQLTNWDMDRSADTLSVIEDGHTSAKKMLMPAQSISNGYESTSAENIDYTEAVWHIQGVLSSVELPPFVVRGKLKDKVKFLRQGVRLSGLNTASFELAVQRIQDIMAIWCRSVSKILPATFVGEDEQGNYLDLSNRYFSSMRDGRGGPAKPFTDDVDPTGVLASMENDQYYHGEENTVLYLQRFSSAQTGKKRLTPIPPVTFKKGRYRRKFKSHSCSSQPKKTRGEWCRPCDASHCWMVSLLRHAYEKACILETRPQAGVDHPKA